MHDGDRRASLQTNPNAARRDNRPTALIARDAHWQCESCVVQSGLVGPVVPSKMRRVSLSEVDSLTNHQRLALSSARFAL